MIVSCWFAQSLADECLQVPPLGWIEKVADKLRNAVPLTEDETSELWWNCEAARLELGPRAVPVALNACRYDIQSLLPMYVLLGD